jgi:hypothetical protein
MPTTQFPALAFRSGLLPGPIIPLIPLAANSFSVAADGSVWVLSEGALMTWQPDDGWVTVASGAFSAALGQGLAAVSNDLVYFLMSGGGVSQWSTAGGVASLPALPNGEQATVIAAAPDGTMFVASSANTVYSFASSTWTALPGTNQSGAITFLSLGNAQFAFAIIQPFGDDAPYALQYNGTSWSVSDALGQYLFACPDGSYWTIFASTILLVNPDGASYGVAAQVTNMIDVGAPFCAGPTLMGFYYVNTGAQVDAVAYGIIDQPPLSWPAMTGTQAAGYTAISDAVGAGAGGIRTQYSNINAPFSEWYALVRTMSCPSGVTPSDWTTIQNQVLSELTDVTSVNTFFTNMAILATNVAQIQTDTYDEVVQMVGLPADPSKQPTSIIQIILGKIFDQMISAAMDAAPKAVSKTINAGISLFKFAADSIATQYGAKNCEEAIHLACAALAGELQAIITSNAQTSGDQQAAILSDWGKLSGCGSAISSGVWYWPPKFDYSVLSSIGDATHTMFYQALMPAMWQIMLIEALDATPVNAPVYSVLYKAEQDSNGNVLAWFWVCAQQGAEPSIWSKGPWPNQHLIEAINDVGSITDFFVGANGWTLPVVTGDGWIAPPDDLPFKPWVDQG